MNILFICTGNQCRSPIAEALMKKMVQGKNWKDMYITSAGLKTANARSAHPNAITVCKDAGLDLSQHRSQLLTEKIIEDSDIILPMDQNHITELQTRFPKSGKKVKLLTSFSAKYQNMDISDPLRGGKFGFISSMGIIRDSLEGLLRTLKR